MAHGEIHAQKPFRHVSHAFHLVLVSFWRSRFNFPGMKPRVEINAGKPFCHVLRPMSAMELGGPTNASLKLPQRVQLECHYGIRALKIIYGMVFGTEFHNGTLIGPSGFLTAALNTDLRRILHILGPLLNRSYKLNFQSKYYGDHEQPKR